MQHIFWSILPIFIITLMGSVIRNKWITSEEFWRGLEKLSYFLLFPILLFNYISTADLSSSSIVKLILGLIISSIILAIGLIIYKKYKPIKNEQFTSVLQGSIRYNSYIFFAICKALYGDDGMLIVSVVSAYMVIFTNVLSVFMFVHYTPEKENTLSDISPTIVVLLRRCSVNPMIIASLLGFLFNYLDLRLNIGIKNTLDTLSDASVTIGIMSVGSGLKFIIDSKYISLITLTCLSKLLIFPIISFIVLSVMSVTGISKEIGILYSGLPCATTSYVLSKQLGGDHNLMASIITITTILSVLTLSIMMYIF